MSAKLEERMAYLERTLEELNEVVVAQTKEMDLMARRVALLMEREAQRQADGGGGVVFGDERPPHY